MAAPYVNAIEQLLLLDRAHTEQTQQAAARHVIRRALDSEDERELLAMLGLTGADA